MGERGYRLLIEDKDHLDMLRVALIEASLKRADGSEYKLLKDLKAECDLAEQLGVT